MPVSDLGVEKAIIDEVCSGLPTTGDPKDLDPTTETGSMISSFKEYASRQKGISPEEIEAISDEMTRQLYMDRQSIQGCRIDMVATFGQLYRSLDVQP